MHHHDHNLLPGERGAAVFGTLHDLRKMGWSLKVLSNTTLEAVNTMIKINRGLFRSLLLTELCNIYELLENGNLPDMEGVAYVSDFYQGSGIAFQCCFNL